MTRRIDGTQYGYPGISVSVPDDADYTTIRLKLDARNSGDPGSFDTLTPTGAATRSARGSYWNVPTAQGMRYLVPYLAGSGENFVAREGEGRWSAGGAPSSGFGGERVNLASTGLLPGFEDPVAAMTDSRWGENPITYAMYDAPPSEEWYGAPRATQEDDSDFGFLMDSLGAFTQGPGRVFGAAAGASSLANLFNLVGAGAAGTGMIPGVGEVSPAVTGATVTSPSNFMQLASGGMSDIGLGGTSYAGEEVLGGGLRLNTPGLGISPSESAVDAFSGGVDLPYESFGASGPYGDAPILTNTAANLATPTGAETFDYPAMLAREGFGASAPASGSLGKLATLAGAAAPIAGLAGGAGGAGAAATGGAAAAGGGNVDFADFDNWDLFGNSGGGDALGMIPGAGQLSGGDALSRMIEYGQSTDAIDPSTLSKLWTAAKTAMGIKSAVGGGTSGEMDSSDMAALMRILSSVGVAGLGAYGANQQGNALRDIAAGARADRAPFLDYSRSLLSGGPEAYAAGPGAGATKGLLNALSVKGNPFGNPGDLMRGSSQLGSLWQNAVTGFGNMGLAGEDTRANLETRAAGADTNVLREIAAGVGDIFTPRTTLADILKALGKGGVAAV